ncbi:MAG: IreB family regulatory phosphoprotein [Ruminococcus sp.]|nr:IreB family regulatory phosphoprotein [Ruminococcus sp.]
MEVVLVQDKTMVFSINGNKDESIRVILTTVYKALEEKGYNPLNQIVGYILSEDPTYITTHNNARNLIRKIDRDDLLEALLKNYLNL